MVKGKNIIFVILIVIFLSFSFYPTIYEVSYKDKLVDQNREFILEHNFYWPDFNLYLSKIRQGFEGRWTLLERYTSEPHQGSYIQEFYLILGQIGRILKMDPNYAYQLGRVILSPLLLLLIYKYCKYFFPQFHWTVLAFIIVLISGSFPRFYIDLNGATQIGRYMEWWSNIDALQRITFIPHILFGQVVSLFLLYQLIIVRTKSMLGMFFRHPDRGHGNGRVEGSSTLRELEDSSTSLGMTTSKTNSNNLTIKQLILYILLGNLAGLVFPPSLITLDGVIILLIIIWFIKIRKNLLIGLLSRRLRDPAETRDNWSASWRIGLFILFTLPSLLYFLTLTKHIPWSALVEAHRLHPMMIPFDQYVLATGPVLILALFGALLSVINRDKRFQPLILWVLSTLLFASFFSVFRDQSPLRFTQTGLFIPLGILGTYFFYQLFHINYLKYLGYLIIFIYVLENLFIMKTSLDWQIAFVNQRVQASRPAVPYPPQTLYPLKTWMDGIRWLRDNTDQTRVVLADITAANFIPAYAGNTVYFGQTNTVAYELKQMQVDQFFSGKMIPSQAELLIKQGGISFVFYSFQEKDRANWVDLTAIYPFLKPVYTNSTVTIYKI